MDFVKKFAEEQFEKQMGGGQQQQQQQQQNYGGEQESYGQGQENSYGGQQGSYGQGQQESYGQNQQESYGQNQQEGSYGNNQQGGDFGVTGGAQYNAPHGSGGASSYGGGGGGGGIPDLDQGAALEAANQHAGNGNENAGLFSQVFSSVSNMNQNDQDVDEDDVQQKHQEAYGQGQAGNMSANAMGSAAALQALKSYTSGGSSASSGGGNMQSKIVGMAMSEAAKLFDQSGGAATGDKQDAMTSAGQTIMKMMLKNQVSGMMGGGQSGGLSSLMGMASKFM